MSRPLVTTVSLATVLAAAWAPRAHAQHNDVLRRNTAYVQLEPIGHPNGNAFPDARVNPPEHRDPGEGVPPGTLSYVWIPRPTSRHGEDEAIDGFLAPLGPSSATTAYPAFLYRPLLAVHRAAAAEGHVEPDPAQLPWFSLPETPLVFPDFGFYEAGTTLLQPLVLPAGETDVIVSLRWSRDDNRWTPDTLQTWGDAHENLYTAPVFGFVSPQGQVTAVSMPADPRSQLALTYRRAAPTVNARSDWGRSYRPPASFPGLFGNGIATYEAPLATTPGQLGWDVTGGAAYANAVAVPMLNVGAVVTASTPFSGHTLELDPLDPALTVLAAAGYVLTLDPTGAVRGPLLPIPVLGSSALGTSIGAEWLVVDEAFTTILATTQAAWVRIAR